MNGGAAKRSGSEAVEPFLRSKSATVTPLNTGQEFAQNFHLLSVDLGEASVQLRPAVSLPQVEGPQFEFGVEAKAKDLFTEDKVTPRPEAPWVNRAKGTIQFTEHLADTQLTEESKDEATESNAAD